MDDCIFCKIINNQIPSYKVYEDDDILAFLDANPMAKGHTLVIPKKHIQDIFEMDDGTLAKMASVARAIAEKMKNSFGAEGVNLYHASGASAEQTVFHAHLHVIPRRAGDSICFNCAASHKEKLSEDDFKEILSKLKIER
jgi:histidine triad (HIT) family protein